MSSWNENQTIQYLQDTILDQEATISELRRDLAQMETQKNFAEVEVDRLERAIEGLKAQRERDRLHIIDLNNDWEFNGPARGIETALQGIERMLQKGITVFVEEG